MKQRLTQQMLESSVTLLDVMSYGAKNVFARNEQEKKIKPLEVLKKVGFDKKCDLCKILGGGRYSWTGSKERILGDDVQVISNQGYSSDAEPSRRNVCFRPLSKYSSIDSIPYKLTRGEDGILRYSRGRKPRSRVSQELSEELDQQLALLGQENCQISPTGRGYTYDMRDVDFVSRQLDDDGKPRDFNPVHSKEYKYKGKYFIKLPVETRYYDEDFNPQYKLEEIWLEVEPIVYLVEEQPNENGEYIAIPEEEQYSGVQFDRDTSDYNLSFGKIYAELRYYVESTEEQLAPQRYVLAEGYTHVCQNCFKGIKGLESVVIPKSCNEIGANAFPLNEFGWAYINDDGLVEFTKTEPKKEYTSVRLEDLDKIYDITNNKFFISANSLKNCSLILDKKFIPPKFMIKYFSGEDIKNLFVNKNDKVWFQLVKNSGYDKIEKQNERNCAIEDLFKIYYALGGFEKSASVRDKAFNYVNDMLNFMNNVDFYHLFHEMNVEQVGYNSEFAEFFMLYFKDNPNFMTFTENEENGYRDYILDAYHKWPEVRKIYKYYQIKTTTDSKRLTPLMVRNSVNPPAEYENVLPGNEELAKVIGRYHYSQEHFEEMQSAFEKAKQIKKNFIISCDKSQKPKEGLTFELLDKTDPLGFVLGDITSCCQRYNGKAKSCVRAGYENPKAGFLVFRNNETIIGQAWIWYDELTKTVCLDNIEMPSKVAYGMFGKERFDKETLFNAVKEAAKSIADSMNSRGVDVDKVTVGYGHNDLTDQITSQTRSYSDARLRDYQGYTDASRQYVLYELSQLDLEERANKAVQTAASALSKICEYAISSNQEEEYNAQV